jgi:hypothetical protein
MSGDLAIDDFECIPDGRDWYVDGTTYYWISLILNYGLILKRITHGFFCTVLKNDQGLPSQGQPRVGGFHYNLLRV